MRRAFLMFSVMLVTLLPLALGVPTASAVILTWDYTVQAGFSAFEPQQPPANEVTSSVPGSLGLLPTVLKWGTAATALGQSALVLTEPASSIPSPPNNPIVTDGGPQPGISITHQNRVINDFNPGALTSATIAGALTLVPKSPPGVPLGPFSVDFLIAFKETPNAAPCLEGPTSNPCADIFVLTQVQTSFGSFTPTGPASFDFVGPDGLPYTLTLNIGSLGPLSADQCGAAGVAGSCVGFLTQEGGDTLIPTSLSIQSAIPEPSTLLLLGSGLAALSLYTRKKAKRAV